MQISFAAIIMWPLFNIHPFLGPYGKFSASLASHLKEFKLASFFFLGYDMSFFPVTNGF